MHDDLDTRIQSAVGASELEAPPAFLQAVRRRRIQRRVRAMGAIGCAVAFLTLGVLYFAPSPASMPGGEIDPFAPDRVRTARANPLSAGALSADTEWISSISLVDLTLPMGDEPPIALRMSRDNAAIDGILDRMMSGS